MFKSFTAKSIAPIAASALVAGLAVFSSFVVATVLLSSVAPEAKAGPQIAAGLHVPHSKADRLPVLAKGAACSTLGWPHYEQNCQFDLRMPATEARTVRVIALR